MAQENANLCHAAIAFENPETGAAVIVRASTGVDLASVRRRVDVPGVPLVYEFDLVDAVGDEDLIILTGQGPFKPDVDGTPIPSVIPINVQRAIGDTTSRRFWVLLAVGNDANCWVQFNVIAPLDAPRTVST